MLCIICILLFSHPLPHGQKRFARKAIESQQAGDYAESLVRINNHIEKDPLHSYGFMLKSKWLSDRSNPWFEPDIAYNVIMLADGQYRIHSANRTKEKRKDLFMQNAVFHDTGIAD